jgi:uncharacterized membrane protein
MEHRATAAVPDLDAERAVSALCAQLRAQAVVDHGTVDWATLTVTGPVEVVGAHGRVWYEWRATARSRTPRAVQDDHR